MPSAPARLVKDLGRAIDRLAAANPPCKDVMIYIGGHGYAPEGSKVPAAQSDKARVRIKVPAGGGQPASEDDLGLEDIRKLVRDRPNLSFKLVVESCFSGRWTLAMAEPNLRITLTSSRQDEVTWLAITHAQAGRQVDGSLQWDESAPVGKPDDPDDPPPFTKGLTQAVDDGQRTRPTRTASSGRRSATRASIATAIALARSAGSTAGPTTARTRARSDPAADRSASRSRPAIATSPRGAPRPAGVFRPTLRARIRS
jgi:hypothetical protein